MQAPKPDVYFGESVALEGAEGGGEVPGGRSEVPVVRITAPPALVEAMPDDWHQPMYAHASMQPASATSATASLRLGPRPS